MKALRITRPLLIHGVLLIGCLVFAFPFLWLLSTSAKRNEELAVFPPEWIPQVPWYSDTSPFIDGGAYGEMKAPDQLPSAAWDRLRPALQQVLWSQIEQRLGPSPLRSISGMTGAEHFRPQMVAGVWAQAYELVPDRVWKESREAAASAPAAAENDPLVVFLRRSVTAEMVTRVTQNVVRRLAVGTILVRHVNNDLVKPETVSAWEGAGPVALAPDEIDGDKCVRLDYDFSRGDAFSVTQTLRLPVTVDDVQVMNLPIHCDGSWHRSSLTVETGGRVYRAERPLWMDIRTWQEAEFAFREPPYRGSRAIVMRPDEGAVSTVADAHTFRATLALEKSGRWRAGLDKYIDSYRWALRYIPFDAQLRNTLILVVLNVLGQLFACSLVAYAFARLNFYGRGFLFGLLLATMMLPGQVTMIPQFILWKTLGWYDTLRPLWVPAWFGGAFFIFLLRQFFMTIPKELEDAAKIDGCGFFGIYWRIMLPLAGPAMATVAIFSFMGAWNEFLGPLVYLSDERLFPLSLGLNQFRQEQSAEWAMLMAASTLMMLPVIAVFFFCQRYFIQGVTLTGLKG
jgi:multiple sugar transport system permease protein